MQRGSNLSSRVAATIDISSRDPQLLYAVYRALRPDNMSLPRDMKLSEELVSNGKTSRYHIKLVIEGDVVHSVRRARATINEILSILKTMTETLESIGESREV